MEGARHINEEREIGLAGRREPKRGAVARHRRSKMLRSWIIIHFLEGGMIKNGMRPMHPGEVLREEVLAELGMSANAFAQALNVPANRITAILNGERSITANTALRLARYLGGGPEGWLNLQSQYDLRVAEIEAGARIAKEVKPRAKAA
jgi:addiction module HigA family antidote